MKQGTHKLSPSEEQCGIGVLTGKPHSKVSVVVEVSLSPSGQCVLNDKANLHSDF